MYFPAEFTFSNNTTNMKIHYGYCNKIRVYLHMAPEVFQEILIKHVSYSVCMTVQKVYAGDEELGKELL